MRLPLAPALLLLMSLAPAASAQFSFVDQVRFVEGTARAADDQGNPPVVNTDRRDASDFGPFVESLIVSQTVPSASATANASQTSTLASTSIVAVGLASGSGGSNDLNGVGWGSANSRTSLEVTFDLLTTADYSLFGLIYNDDNAIPGVRLVSASGAVILDVQYPGFAATTPFNQNGVLQPGRYTLTAEATGSGYGNAWWSFSDRSRFELDFVVVPQPVGSSDCAPPAANSSGTSASVGAIGSNLVAEADLTLTANGAVPGQFGLFFYGAPGAPTPFGAGTLCIAGPLFRLSAPLQADVFGLASHAVDFGAWPVNAGAGAWTVGSTWAFQFWYRDPGVAAGFTASDRLTVEFF